MASSLKALIHNRKFVRGRITRWTDEVSIDLELLL